LKPVKTDDILESASRIIQQHGKDKKSESPYKAMFKKEDKAANVGAGVFIPQGLGKSK
jgi:hypothetical protein